MKRQTVNFLIPLLLGASTVSVYAQSSDCRTPAISASRENSEYNTKVADKKQTEHLQVSLKKHKEY